MSPWFNCFAELVSSPRVRPQSTPAASISSFSKDLLPGAQTLPRQERPPLGTHPRTSLTELKQERYSKPHVIEKKSPRAASDASS
jgi:hypothetical protein